MNWLNEHPYEHHGSNGARFYATRSDLKDGVRIVKPSFNYSDTQFAQDLVEFGAMHNQTMEGRLNGFQGYDSIKYVIDTPF